MKRKYIVICLYLFIALIIAGCHITAPTVTTEPFEQNSTAMLMPTPDIESQPEMEASAIVELEQLLEEIYGEGYVIKLPGQEGYARIYPDSKFDYRGAQDISLVQLYPDERRDEPENMNGPYTLSPSKERFKVGENITITFSNNSSDPEDTAIIETFKFFLDIFIDGVWYTITPYELWQSGGAVSIEPGESIDFELTSKSLNDGWLFKYNEESGLYEFYRDFEREIELIPGHYRYGKNFDADHGYFAYCEFDVVG